MSYLQVQNSAVNRSTSVFKCDSTINYTPVTTMQQPSTTHYISIRQEAGAFLKVVFSMKDPKCVNQTATQRSSCPGQKSRNQLDIEIYSLNLTQRQAQILEKWSESFQGAIADVLAQWCHHKMSFILVPYELLWFCIIISYVSVWSYVFGVASSGSASCSSFRIHFLFLELSGPFRWTHLMRMWVWLFGNTPLRPVVPGERLLPS